MTSALIKARQINEDPTIYGTFAEIGAGQEVARHFFQAGHASATVAKTISAYDMTMSDEIYGKETRYVSRARLQKMLTKEFQLLLERLGTKQASYRFFAFADTMATRSSKVPKAHGWLGVMFQHLPGAAPSSIHIHIELKEGTRLQQQNWIGELGVQLLFSCYHHHHSVKGFLSSLTEGVARDWLQIDFVWTEGPAFTDFSLPEVSLQLLHDRWAHLLCIDQQQMMLLSDLIYKKPLLIQRGHFSPPTTTHQAILTIGKEQLARDFQIEGEPLELLELHLPQLPNDPCFQDIHALAQRIDMTSLWRKPLVITTYPYFYQTKDLYRYWTLAPMAFTLSAKHLESVFSSQFYQDLRGGMLEGLGRLMDHQTKLYIYPHKTSELCQTASTLFLAPPEKHIYNYFRELQHIVDLASCEEIENYISSRQIRERMKMGDGWQEFVPEELLGYLQKSTQIVDFQAPTLHA